VRKFFFDGKKKFRLVSHLAHGVTLSSAIGMYVPIARAIDFESFNGRLTDALLGCEVFDKVLEAKALIKRWRMGYDTVRRIGRRRPR
jgi:hypothetical protein